MQTKQVIVLRKDLNMRKGKMIAQGAHASMKVLFDRIHSFRKVGQEHTTAVISDLSDAMIDWMDGSFTKVCVSVDSEQELVAIYEHAKLLEIPCAIITDSGKTEFNDVPTKTAVAIGPAEVEKVDLVTGKLKLL